MRRPHIFMLAAVVLVVGAAAGAARIVAMIVKLAVVVAVTARGVVPMVLVVVGEATLVVLKGKGHGHAKRISAAALDANNRLQIGKFYKWWWSFKFFRIWEFYAAAVYNPLETKIDGMLDMEFFCQKYNLKLSLVFSLLEMQESFYNTIKQL